LLEEAEAAREHLLDEVSHYDDDLVELILEEQEIPADRLRAAIRAATLSSQMTPVLCGSSFKNKGVQPLLDAVIDFLPSPEDVPEIYAGDIAAAVGIKQVVTGDTLAAPDKPIKLESIEFDDPVISVAIEPKTKSDQEKMSVALGRLAEEDPTFQVRTNEETG